MSQAAKSCVSSLARVSLAGFRASEDGEVTVTQGGLSPRILGDLRDVLSRPRVKRATVRIVRAKDRARLEVAGEVSEQQLQRLRNIVGNVPVAQIARGERP